MKEPKHIVYEYAGNVCPSDVKEDLAGDIQVPEAGSVIVHNGYWWKVVETSKEGAKTDFAVYRVLLKRSVGHGRV
jgi:hypothetical protein